jgi:hypothetical protein
MKKRYWNRDLLILSILTVITVFSWVTFEVYRALTQVEIPAVLKQQIEPLNPTIQTEIIQGLKSRKSFSTDELVSPSSLPEANLKEETATESGEGEEVSVID